MSFSYGISYRKSEAANIPLSRTMETRVCLLAVFLLVFFPSIRAAGSNTLFDDNFSKSCPETNFKTSEDGQIWYLSLDKQAGIYNNILQIFLFLVFLVDCNDM